LVAVSLAGFVVAHAQQGQVAGPIVGYVFDGSARALRPVLGIPGASIVGGAVEFAYDLASVTVSPGADSAVVTAGDGSLHLAALGGGSAAEISFNGASVKPDRVVFSPSGTAVALIAAGRVQIFSGLPVSATLVGTMDLAGIAASRLQAESARRPAPAHAASMALSDDGAWLLTVEDGSVELIGAGGSHGIANAGRGAMVAFAPGSHDAAFADPVAQTVVLMRDASGATAPQVVWQDASVRSAAGLAFSMDGKSLFLASGAGPAVTIYDLAAGTHTGVSCSCSVTGLERMGSVYRVNDLGSGPLWLLDAAASNPRTVFVPAAGASE
jgi:hypothetical protein